MITPRRRSSTSMIASIRLRTASIDLSEQFSKLKKAAQDWLKPAEVPGEITHHWSQSMPIKHKKSKSSFDIPTLQRMTIIRPECSYKRKLSEANESFEDKLSQAKEGYGFNPDVRRSSLLSRASRESYIFNPDVRRSSILSRASQESKFGFNPDVKRSSLPNQVSQEIFEDKLSFRKLDKLFIAKESFKVKLPTAEESHAAMLPEAKESNEDLRASIDQDLKECRQDCSLCDSVSSFSEASRVTDFSADIDASTFSLAV